MAPEAREPSFGTGGIRGLMGEGPGRVNRALIVRAAEGVLAWLGDARGAGIVVCHDTRHRSGAFARAAAEALAAGGAPVFLVDEPAPTPLAAFAVRRMGLAAGVAITASHNPAEYNGVKVYGPDGAQIGVGDAEAVAAAMGDSVGPRAGAPAPIRPLPRWVPDAYVGCARALHGGGAPIRVAYTPLHGAGRALVARALEGLPGVTAFEVARQAEPDGDFPTCPRPNPEDPEAFRIAIGEAERLGADAALATDPDCDRAALALRDASGRFRVLSGNEAGALLLEARLARWRGPRPPIVVKTWVTTGMANRIAERFGAEVIEVPTGFKHIGAALRAMEADGAEGRFAFAFEESGGYLADSRVRDKDGLQAAVLLCDLAQRLKRDGRPIDRALDDLGARYGHIADGQRAYPAAEAPALMAALRADPPKALLGEPILVLDGAAGLRLSGGDFAAILRASGTEPALKAYLSARGASAPAARARLDGLGGEIARWVLGNR